MIDSTEHLCGLNVQSATCGTTLLHNLDHFEGQEHPIYDLSHQQFHKGCYASIGIIENEGP